MPKYNRPPYFPLYPADFTSDGNVEAMSTLELGAYFLLLCKAWAETPSASVPDDDAILSRWTRLSDEEWSKSKAKIMRPWKLKKDGRYHQKRLREEFDRFQSNHNAKSKSGKIGAASKWKSTNNTSSETRAQRLKIARQKGTHTKEEFQEMVNIFDGTCVRCGKSDDGVFRDHIIPIYQGGSDGIDNLQPLCRKCNTGKGSEAIDHRISFCDSRGIIMPSKWLQNNACQTPDECLSNACLSVSVTEKDKERDRDSAPVGVVNSRWYKTDFEDLHREWVGMGLSEPGMLTETEIHNLYGFLSPLSISDAREAMRNYATIIRSPDFWYNKLFTFYDFYTRHFGKFLSSQDPFAKYRQEKAGEYGKRNGNNGSRRKTGVHLSYREEYPDDTPH